MKVENQEIIDNALGSGAYDIGHVFGTSGGSGGEASIPAACISGDKAEGASVTSLPIVSIFEIEVVAHEIGHQLGANHTFNGTSIACGAQRTPGSAYEPGAGSTIMAYVHKCFPEDLQPANDAYFHSRSIEQISDHIGAAGSCAVSTSTGNSAPVVEAGPNYTIPKATPFTLTAAGSDPNGDPVFYSWEQYDLGGAGPPDNDSDGQGKPIFRSFPATLSSSRAFPSLANILDYGNVPPALLVIDSHFYMPGESLPLISRTMTFRVTARDFRSGGGGVSSDEMQVTVDGSSEPFFVTTPTTPTVWAAGIPHTVTWNVGSTSVAPINCSTVRILLSTDGGLTFPPNLILSSGTANDGSEDITVPTNVSSSEARIKVEAVSNIFFDVSDTNFIIPAGTCAYSINLSVSTPNVNAQSKSFNVSTTGSCDWVARSNVDWITFQPGNPVNRIQGSGSATITFQVTSNANGAKRTGTISIGGLTHTVTQDGGTFTSSISPLSNTFTFNAGSGAIAVSMDPNSFWYAFSSDPWISIVSGKSGRGPGNIIFSVARNVSASQRTGSLKVGAQTFSVTQGAFNSATTLKLSGTIFGTPGAFQPGSERDKAYDGNVQTYFDADLANANGAYTGIDLGSGNAKKIVKIRFFPRSDFVGGPDRMVGGKFQGSNSSESTGFVDLYTIPFAPAISSWVELTITDPTTFRYLRYLSPNGGFCNVAEVEFYTDTGAPPSNNAAFVSQNVPASMTASQSYSVSVTMSNTGTTTWTVVTYYLGSQNPQGNTTWGLNQVNLTTSVPPNSQAVFNFSVTAPSTAGTYNFQWQMANGAGVFGAPSTNVVVTVSTSGSPVKLTGTAFGTSPPFQAGREFDKAVDGNTSTYFDFSVGDGGYAGIDLGAGNGKSVVKIRYYPRSDFAGGPDRMVGGKFQGSNTSSSSGYVDLHTVTTAPPIGTWIEVTISNPTTFRYLRYLGPNGSYCNVAEIEFYTPAPPKLTGTAFGTSPPWQAGREFDKAVDGNTSTYFDFSVSDGGYTGIDLGAGNGKSVVKIRYYPRSDFAGGPDRMVGGKFQGSNTSSSSGYVDLHTITTAPPIGTWIEVIISNPTTFRYLRYLGANGSFCNVAEIEFYGN
jgi:hypothetical protein